MSDGLTKAQLQESLDRSPFMAGLKLTVETIDASSGAVAIRLPFSETVERAPGTGQVHGGVIAALIDIAGDYAVGVTVGGGVPTINFRVDYLRPAIASDLVAHATCRRVGKTVGVADVDVLDSAGRVVAVGRGCYASKTG